MIDEKIETTIKFGWMLESIELTTKIDGVNCYQTRKMHDSLQTKEAFRLTSIADHLYYISRELHKKATKIK